ncbi:putative lipid II flippase FtsW [Corynebacterium amycolatum]|uniref:putative lipid II flippase FtsW n=1 Tax=Corynebacterium amycolatum TaxID=43765 RepID=UPI00211A4A0E|nr:putative lipid II flippase FtsW [Corynebacterium amycolatum]MCQ9127728.1 putative lipid II flippase FtsW [Corynebacterium amycolatum]MCQ9141080.1 putative lipid II flippase FtsW [Corynebacterium amycolatum]
MDNSRKARNLSASAATAQKGTKATKAQQPSSSSTSARERPAWVERFNDWKSRPLFDYHLLMIIVALLTSIGLVMVLSASMASAGNDSGSVWSVFIRQLVMVVAGLISMWIVLRMRVELIRSLSTAALILSFVLLVLVIIPGIGIGLEETGARSWLSIGGITMQPSEIAKIALALWGSKLLAEKVRTAVSYTDLFGLFGAVSFVILALVMLQRDLGMVASMAFVVVALAWFAGLPRVFITGLLAAAAFAMVIFTVTAGFRSARIRVYLDSLLGNFNDVQGDAYQSYQGFLSLADGSLTGVGLGQSSAKWGYLPEAKNDFIFAIIGEETGFLGALMVILLYAALGWVGLRIAGRQNDPFLRLLAGTITAATVVQAFINIGYVVGALPVTGLQLPLISAGGTSAMVTLFSMGLLATCARHESEAVSAMQTSGRPALDRFLGIPEPIPYDESRRHAPKVRAHRDPQRFGPPVVTSGARTPRGEGAQVRETYSGRADRFNWAGRSGGSRSSRGAAPQRGSRTSGSSGNSGSVRGREVDYSSRSDNGRAWGFTARSPQAGRSQGSWSSSSSGRGSRIRGEGRGGQSRSRQRPGRNNRNGGSAPRRRNR